MVRQVVVSHFNEDLEWTKDLDEPPLIYDKGEAGAGIRLPNIGREAHTFLHHICTNYARLPDYTFFLQGNPFDHFPKDGFFDIYHHYTLSLFGFGVVFSSDENGNPYHQGLPVGQYHKEFFTNKQNRFWFHQSGQYLVHKRLIQNKSLRWWQRWLQKCVDNEAEFPWVMERLWMLSFTENPSIIRLNPTEQEHGHPANLGQQGTASVPGTSRTAKDPHS